MKLVSVMGADQQAEVDKLDNSALPQLPVSFEINSEADNDGLSVFAVIDPLGKNAHRVAPLLLVRWPRAPLTPWSQWAFGLRLSAETRHTHTTHGHTAALTRLSRRSVLTVAVCSLCWITSACTSSSF